jgi:hypothetical protein
LIGSRDWRGGHIVPGHVALCGPPTLGGHPRAGTAGSRARLRRPDGRRRRRARRDVTGPGRGAPPGRRHIRADNAIIDHRGGRARLVDWGYGCAGADWLDRARLAADIVGTGHEAGHEPALRSAVAVLERLPAGAGRFVVALAGMWRYRATLPPLPGHPTLRSWQHHRARAVRPLVDWASARRAGVSLGPADHEACGMTRTDRPGLPGDRMP